MVITFNSISLTEVASVNFGLFNYIISGWLQFGHTSFRETLEEYIGRNHLEITVERRNRGWYRLTMPDNLYTFLQIRYSEYLVSSTIAPEEWEDMRINIDEFYGNHTPERTSL